MIATGAPTAFDTLILVMRHAEKPADDADPHLAPAGAARAQTLAAYIPTTFGDPDVILAAAVSTHSARPFETVEPLAMACGVAVQTPFKDAEYAAQAHALRTDPARKGKRIVVCWHHGEIPALMQALGAPRASYPDPWDPTVFNLILKTNLAADGTVAVAQIQEPF